MDDIRTFFARERLALMLKPPPPSPTYEFGSLRDVRDAVEMQSRRALEMAFAAGLAIPQRGS